jgi:hypothetical protein
MTPAFLITMDTEGDNLWARPRAVTTRNAEFLPRFQSLAEKHGWRPTWLVNWEMAHEPRCVEFLQDALKRRVAEVGLHLHAWDTPPLMPLTEDDTLHHPFLIEYPEDVMREKIALAAGKLEETFQRPLHSHRAGRWAFDGRYARLLREQGLLADCSVCPGVDWSPTQGDPLGSGGPDYRLAPRTPYRLSEEDVTQAVESSVTNALLEVPMTTGAEKTAWWRRAATVFSPRHYWLRPNGNNIRAMVDLVDAAVKSGSEHVMFMLHSSELMPGGSPTFRDAESIERLYDDIEVLFARAAKKGCRAATLGEFAATWHASAATPLAN